MSRTVNEGSAITVIATPVDRTRTPITPSSMRYKLVCLKNRQTILDWTDLTPATRVEIEVTGEQNAIINSCNPTEEKQVIVETVSAGKTRNDKETWRVQNLYGVE